jgi:integrase
MAKPYKRGETYWGRVYHKGEEYRKSLETTSRAVAEERLQHWKRELKGSEWGEKPRRTFEEATRRYLAEHVPRLKNERVRAGYIRSLLRFTEHLDGKRLDEISSGILSQFEAARRADGVVDGTIRRDLTVLSGLFSHAILWEWAVANPAASYLAARAKQGMKESDPETRYLSHDEERAFVNYIAHKRTTAKGHRDQHAWLMFEAAFCLAINSGLRKEEQLSLLWTDVDLEHRQLTIRKEISKTKRQRSVPILPRSLDLLRALPRHPSSPYVFWLREGKRYTDCYRTLVRHAAKLNLEPLRWHDLRRTCGCRLLQDYVLPMERVSAWLGHQSVKTTERIYAFLDVRHLHAALAGVAHQPHIEEIKSITLIEKSQ